jgi:glucose-6-phosphate dehydrogenase assembly protein OpcA
MKIVYRYIFSFLLLVIANGLAAQCSLCAKTSQQMGEKPAEGMNSGIIYLMITPLLIVGVIAFRWWKNNKAAESNV